MNGRMDGQLLLRDENRHQRSITNHLALLQKKKKQVKSDKDVPYDSIINEIIYQIENNQHSNLVKIPTWRIFS